MAYSETTGQTKINVDQLIAYAFREAGKTAEEMTPEYVDAGKQALFYNLQNLSNLGVNLWLLENQLYGTVGYQQKLTLPKTTIDIREANWVYVQNIEISDALPADNPDSANVFDQNLNTYGTTTEAKNWFGAYYNPAQQVFYVGINAYVPGAIGSTTTYTLAYETSADGVTWTTRQVFDPVTLTDREWKYWYIDTTPNYSFYRLRELTADTMSLRQVVFSQSTQVIPLARLNRDDYWNLPNKQFSSQRSLQYWYDRQIEPSMYLWPTPNNDFQMFQLIVEKQMMDVGSLTNEIYVPDRWITSVQASLSHKLALQIPGVDMGRITYLEQQAEKLFMQANNEERDKSPIYFQPAIGYYTR
jgi:hypothetical protein